MSWFWLSYSLRSFFGLIQWMKVGFERRQNFGIWWICLMYGIWWKVFKKANSRALPFIFRSEILPNDSIPVLNNLISNTKHTARTSWIVGSTLHIPSFSPTRLFKIWTSKTSIGEIWCQKFDEKICQKKSDQIFHSSFSEQIRSCWTHDPNVGNFFLWCTLLGKTLYIGLLRWLNWWFFTFFQRKNPNCRSFFN